mmetsp:Transcript_31757/g.105205  ORF Transcript_31757/g.105205 Transcript_31757/m.105205 type:complete len:243 (+) Transcript_31757:1173-1901(+)
MRDVTLVQVSKSEEELAHHVQFVILLPSRSLLQHLFQGRKEILAAECRHDHDVRDIVEGAQEAHDVGRGRRNVHQTEDTELDERVLHTTFPTTVGRGTFPALLHHRHGTPLDDDCPWSSVQSSLHGVMVLLDRTTVLRQVPDELEPVLRPIVEIRRQGQVMEVCEVRVTLVVRVRRLWPRRKRLCHRTLTLLGASAHTAPSGVVLQTAHRASCPPRRESSAHLLPATARCAARTSHASGNGL